MTGPGRPQIAPHFLQILPLSSSIWPHLQIGALALGAFLLLLANSSDFSHLPSYEWNNLIIYYNV